MSVPMGGGYYQTAPKIDFGWISQGWNLVKPRLGVWIGAMLIYLIIAAIIDGLVGIPTGYWAQIIGMVNASRSGVPATPVNPVTQYVGSTLFGLIANLVNFVLIGGLYRMALRQARGEEISVADFFSVGDVAVPLLIAGLLTGIAVSIGNALCILPGIVLQGLFLFAPLLIVDRRLGGTQAIGESVNLLKSQWLAAAGFYFCVALVGGIGFLLFGIGLLLTYPIMIGAITVGYLAFTQPYAAMPTYGAQQAGVWPPPPQVGTPPPSQPPFGQAPTTPPAFGQGPTTPPAFGQTQTPPPAAQQTPPPANPFAPQSAPPPAANPFAPQASAPPPANPFAPSAGTPPPANPFAPPPEAPPKPPRTSLSGEPLDAETTDEAG